MAVSAPPSMAIPSAGSVFLTLTALGSKEKAAAAEEGLGRQVWPWLEIWSKHIRYFFKRNY